MTRNQAGSVSSSPKTLFRKLVFENLPPFQLMIIITGRVRRQ